MSLEISVIIPTFNRADRIAASIDSVLRQDFQAWELIVVDDGSADHTSDVIESIHRRHPEHSLVYIRQDNAGPSVARNNGVQHARADIIVYLDSDDRLYPSALSDIAWTLKDRNFSYGITNHNRTLRLVDKHGVILFQKFDASGLNREVTLEQIYKWDIKTTSSGLFHRKALFDQGVRWRSKFWIEDLELLMQMAVLAPQGFAHIPKVLVDYVQVYGADGLCSNATYEDWAVAFGSIYELHMHDPLMKDPSVYLDRVKKYNALHQEVLAGKIPPPHYKYFPEFYPKNN